MRFLAPLLILGRFSSAFVGSQTHVIPSGQINGTASSDKRVGVSPFDGPHVSANNGSAYQWWYFDAVSSDSSSAVVAQFYPGWFPDANGVLLNIAFPNGTQYSGFLPVGTLELSTIGDGSQGFVEDGAMTWFGASDLSAYHVTLNLPQVGVSGKITMRSRAPPHVACGLKKDGASFEFAPFLAWGNAVPDSYADVDLVVNGTELSFTGSGYHDQNWGAAAFDNALTQWYWGHSNVGSYSLVFFYHLDQNLKVTSSIYLSENGKPIISGCSVGTVTPQGPGTSVPLKRGTDVKSWAVAIDDPVRGKYAFTVENTAVIAENVAYTRWTGLTTGGRVGGKNSTGAGIIEWMNNPAL